MAVDFRGSWLRASSERRSRQHGGVLVCKYPTRASLLQRPPGFSPLREEIWRALALLRQQGQTILVIDKYVQRLIALADRHVILEKRCVVWSGPTAALDADRNLWHRYLGVWVSAQPGAGR